jgi:hypothetical protein
MSLYTEVKALQQQALLKQESTGRNIKLEIEWETWIRDILVDYIKSSANEGRTGVSTYAGYDKPNDVFNDKVHKYIVSVMQNDNGSNWSLKSSIRAIIGSEFEIDIADEPAGRITIKW